MKTLSLSLRLTLEYIPIISKEKHFKKIASNLHIIVGIVVQGIHTYISKYKLSLHLLNCRRNTQNFLIGKNCV